MHNKPCYFWIDNSVPFEEQVVVAICESCQNSKQLKNAWFWQDKYGNFDINCHICNCAIHNFDQKARNDKRKN
jgi:hypothetical protein